MRSIRVRGLARVVVALSLFALLLGAGDSSDPQTHDNRNPRPAESLPLLAPGDDLPVSRANPVAGDIETVDTFEAAGVSNVRHVVEINAHTKVAFLVSGDLVDDLAPRLAIDSEGHSWTVWWRDLETDRVLFRHLDRDCCWSRMRNLSGDLQDARHPEITIFRDRPWVSYEATDASGASIHVGVIHDEPDPFGLTAIASTGYDGHLDSLIESAGDHLWVSWLDAEHVLAWSVYDPEEDRWSDPESRSFAGSSIVQARDELQERITGGTD